MVRSSGSALRQRVTRANASADSHAVLGAAPANAYFNAKRLRKGSGARAVSSTTGKRKGAVDEQEEEEEAEEEAKPTKTKKSAKKLATAFTVRPVSENVEILRHVDAREDAWRKCQGGKPWPTFEQQYPKWMSQLRAGFNVLLHGVGSKLGLMQTFADRLPTTDYVIQIHGYLPSVTLTEMIEVLQTEVFEIPSADAARIASRSFVQQCRAIVDFAFDNRQQQFPHAYLIIYALDGQALRDPELQAGLARLAMAPFVHVIASVDSVNAPALWAEDDAQRFRWIHHRVDTLRPYVREIDLRLSREGKAALRSISGVRYILQSLTPTDVGTLRLIAKHQLARGSSKDPEAAAPTAPRGRQAEQHTDYHAVYLESRKQLLHATMQSMKNSIKCLEDNGLVKVLRVKNVEKLLIPLADELLESEIVAPGKAVQASGALTKKG